ncbi:hypothetical protein C1H70_04270 [Halomonas urumqiensis]|uniref:Uncharacterized protein n=1 Tax=Halomonas urumqiensis TaxID=1684789 RepID=A0A2N7UMG4_9GAMM|nr:hypothetical protein C1H70_04270 [Halomonas urumqiensis]PTB02255.1 hypothetical protein C6V82_11250 [Halomonas urumqiensis]
MMLQWAMATDTSWRLVEVFASMDSMILWWHGMGSCQALLASGYFACQSPIGAMIAGDRGSGNGGIDAHPDNVEIGVVVSHA